MFQIKLANKIFYKISIGKMNMKLLELQKLNKEFLKIRTTIKLYDWYKKVDKMLHHQKLLFILKII